MKKLFGGIKDRKFLFFAVIVSAVLVTAVFLFSILFNSKKQQENPIAPAEPKEKTMEEVIKDLTASVDGVEAVPISKELIESLTIPVDSNNNLEDNKKEQSTQISISEEVINSLTAPIK